MRRRRIGERQPRRIAFAALVSVALATLALAGAAPGYFTTKGTARSPPGSGR
jgi:hypothetical protein